MKNRDLSSNRTGEVKGDEDAQVKILDATPTQSTSTIKITNSEKPSSPDKYYKVGKDETLFVVAQKNNLTWTEIAAANGLTDPDKIQAGQNLIIPGNDGVNFSLNNDKAQSLQAAVDSGKYEFRLDPVATAKSDVPGVYGLNGDDNFTLTNSSGGNKIVSASRDGSNFLITLNQPVKTGEKGIWVVIKVSPED